MTRQRIQVAIVVTVVAMTGCAKTPLNETSIKSTPASMSTPAHTSVAVLERIHTDPSFAPIICPVQPIENILGRVDEAAKVLNVYGNEHGHFEIVGQQWTRVGAGVTRGGHQHGIHYPGGFNDPAPNNTIKPLHNPPTTILEVH